MTLVLAHTYQDIDAFFSVVYKGTLERIGKSWSSGQDPYEHTWEQDVWIGKVSHQIDDHEDPPIAELTRA